MTNEETGLLIGAGAIALGAAALLSGSSKATTTTTKKSYKKKVVTADKTDDTPQNKTVKPKRNTKSGTTNIWVYDYSKSSNPIPEKYNPPVQKAQKQQTVRSKTDKKEVKKTDNKPAKQTSKPVVRKKTYTKHPVKIIDTNISVKAD